MTLEELTKIVEKHASELGEHFDCVEILASNSDGDGSRCVKRGAGNYYARIAMAQEFVDEDRARTLGKIIHDFFEEE